MSKAKAKRKKPVRNKRVAKAIERIEKMSEGQPATPTASDTIPQLGIRTAGAKAASGSPPTQQPTRWDVSTRVSPPGGAYGNPDLWPVAHRIDAGDNAITKLEKLLDALHPSALVAWDRDVRLKDSETITVATSDGHGPGGEDILGYAYVDSTMIYRLHRDPADPLEVKWIGYQA